MLLGDKKELLHMLVGLDAVFTFAFTICRYLLLHLLCDHPNNLLSNYYCYYCNDFIISFVVAGTANAGFNVVLTALINIAWVAGIIVIIIIVYNQYYFY